MHPKPASTHWPSSKSNCGKQPWNRSAILWVITHKHEVKCPQGMISLLLMHLRIGHVLQVGEQVDPEPDMLEGIFRCLSFSNACCHSMLPIAAYQQRITRACLLIL